MIVVTVKLSYCQKLIQFKEFQQQNQLSIPVDMDYCPPSASWLDKSQPKVSPQRAPVHPPFEAFNKYLESYVSSFALAVRKRVLKEKIRLLKNRLTAMQNSLEELHEIKESTKPQNDSGVKRRRRTADDIERIFECPFERCGKVYGTLGSLQQHHRLKHTHEPPNSSSGLPENTS